MSKHFLACLWVYEGACCLIPPVFIFFTMVVTYFSFVVFVHVELSATAKKLNGVLTVLVDCFQDFFPVIHGTLPLDAQSFDCILGILQSIDLAIQFFVHEIQKGEPELEHGGQKMTLWCKNIAPSLFKKILGVFPLTAAHLL